MESKQWLNSILSNTRLRNLPALVRVLVSWFFPITDEIVSSVWPNLYPPYFINLSLISSAAITFASLSIDIAVL